MFSRLVAPHGPPAVAPPRASPRQSERRGLRGLPARGGGVPQDEPGRLPGAELL